MEKFVINTLDRKFESMEARIKRIDKTVLHFTNEIFLNAGTVTG